MRNFTEIYFNNRFCRWNLGLAVNKCFDKARQNMAQRKLILSCSKRKIFDERVVPAIERYDGTAFRLLRRYQRIEGENLDVYILSARFGLIAHTKKIFYYDSKMTLFEARQMKSKILRQAEKLFLDKNGLAEKQIFINLGRNYCESFSEVFPVLANCNITLASGSSGKRLAQMHDWLYGEKSDLRQVKIIKKSSMPVKLRGIEIHFTREEIYALVLERANETNGASDFHSWFVAVGNRRVSPKWIVSQITGLPPGKFHSDEARRVLQQLGIEVKRV